MWHYLHKYDEGTLCGISDEDVQSGHFYTFPDYRDCRLDQLCSSCALANALDPDKTLTNEYLANEAYAGEEDLGRHTTTSVGEEYQK